MMKHFRSAAGVGLGTVLAIAAARLVAQTPQAPPATPPAQAAPAAPEPTGESKSVIIQRVLVKVNGEIFTQKELEQRQIDVLRDQGKTTATPKDIEAVTPDLLVNAVDEMLVVQRGKELGLHSTDEQFKRYIESLKTDNKLTDAEFKQALTQEGFTLDMLRASFDKQSVIQMVKQREILGKINLTEEEARQYYDKHPEAFLQPATVTLREILVNIPAETSSAAGGQPTFKANVEEAARDKITAARERVLKAEDFAKVAAEVSDSPSKSKGGLLDPIEIDAMASGIRDTLEKMKPGEITPIIRTTRGFQIFKLEARTTPARKAFQDVRDEIAQKVGEERMDVEMKKYITTLRAQALIEWKRDDLRQMYEKRIAELK